jgi:2,4-dienoyl-CoA reductase-like NADH-dependent reductase (Old Yellow Enzyme family)
MEQALQEGSTDLVGLARPLCSEPFLIRDMIEGKSEGAKPNKSVSIHIYSDACSPRTRI